MANKDSHNGALNRDFKGIYDVLRDMVLRGYRDSNAYSHIFVSRSKYSAILAKIRFMFFDIEEDMLKEQKELPVLQEERKGRKKQYYFLNQPMKWQDNPLAGVWRYAIPDRTDLFFYLNILQELGTIKGKKIEKLTGDVISNIEAVFEGEKKYEEGETEELENGIERTLPKLEAHGIICKELLEGKNSYRIEKNIWHEDFLNGELQEIYDYLSFLKNAMPFELPYYFLQNNLKLYMLAKGIEPRKEPLFLFRHRNIVNVIDSEKIYVFLKSIKSKKPLKIVNTEKYTELHRLKRDNQEYDTREVDGSENEILAKEIKYNRKTGQLHLLASNIKENEDSVFWYGFDRIEFADKKKPTGFRDIFHVFHSVYFERIFCLCNQEKDSFNEIEMEKTLFKGEINIPIKKELLPKEGKDSLFLYDKENRKYCNNYKKIPFFSTRIHREALKSLEDIPYTKAFLRQSTIDKIKKQMENFESSWDIKDIKKCFREKQEEEILFEINEEIAKKIRGLLQAIRNEWIILDKKGKSFVPLRLQYSIRNEKIRLFVYDPEQEDCKMLLWEEIDFSQIIKNRREFIHKVDRKEVMQKAVEKQETLKIKLVSHWKTVNADNLLTRDLFMVLSSYERKVSYSEETGEFDIEIKCWPDDKAELIEDIKANSVGFRMEIS